MMRSKNESCSCYTLLYLLACSTVANVFLITKLYVNSDRILKQQQLGWSQRAAQEAEAVASISCSGHGRAYLDGLLAVDGKPVCECDTCFHGPQCSQFIPDCAADADSGNPLFLEPFWVEHAASSALLVAGWHRMSYKFPDSSYVSQELEKLIRTTHEIAKNAKTDGKYILFGVGSAQLLNAAVFALSINYNSSSPAKVVASTPYYPFYKFQTDYFRNRYYEFTGDTASLLKKNITLSNVIEFVTSPNNPDGQLKKPVLQGPSVSTIHDHAYYWPHFTAIPAPSDEELMIFTISKLTGHAGSRFGWAIIKDENVYQIMKNYITIAEMGTSRDTQLRALQLLRVALEDDGKNLFNFASRKMMIRWENLTRIMSSSKRFSLQEISPKYCNFFKKIRGPSPAYAWLKCEYEEDRDCSQVLQSANIIGREGTMFNADNRYIRLSLLKSDYDFEYLLHRLNELVSMEDGAEAVQQL